MAAAPLSDAIRAVASERNPPTLDAFIDKFLASRVGVVATNLPPDRGPGETFQTGPGDDIQLTLVSTPDGRSMVKACADPAEFVRRYPDANVNALIDGRELLEIVLKVSDVDGVLVCSATAFESLPIGRAEIPRWLGRACATPHRVERRPWWRFWG